MKNQKFKIASTLMGLVLSSIMFAQTTVTTQGNIVAVDDPATGVKEGNITAERTIKASTIAIGEGASANTYSVAMGPNSFASSNAVNGAFAIGNNARAESAFGSFAFGSSSKSQANSAIAIGTQTEACGPYGFAIGYQVYSGKTPSGGISVNGAFYSYAMGFNVTNTASDSFAIGRNSNMTGWGSMSYGIGLNVNGYREMVLGSYNDPSVSNNGSPDTWVLTDPLFVIGNGKDYLTRSNALVMLKNGDTTLKGKLKVKELEVENGTVSVASGGTFNVAGGITFNGDLVSPISGKNFLMGDYTDFDDYVGNCISGRGIFAMGDNLEVMGDDNFVFGNRAGAYGIHNFVLGDGGVYGNSSYVLGSASIDGNNSYAVGNNTYVGGDSSYAFGSSITNEGCYNYTIGREIYVSQANESYVFGYDSQVYMGNENYVIGRHSCVQDGNYNFTFGDNLYVSASMNYAIGRYNDDTIYENSDLGEWVETDPLFVIGNGRDDDNRSNALVMYKNGNTDFNNSVKVKEDMVVEGKTELKGEVVLTGETKLNGRVVLAEAQGDIPMGIFGRQ